MLLLNHPELSYFFFKKTFHKNRQTIWIVCNNIRNMYVNYSHFGHIHFKLYISELLSYFNFTQLNAFHTSSKTNMIYNHGPCLT